MRRLHLLLMIALTAAALPPLGLVASAAADDPVTWFFDETTEGENVYWTSPTAVRPSAWSMSISSVSTSGQGASS